MKQFCKITYPSPYIVVKYVSVSIEAEQIQLNIPNLPLGLLTKAESRHVYTYSLRLGYFTRFLFF